MRTDATVTYVDRFNHRRIHNEIGKIQPAELEANYCRQNKPGELVASQTTESL
jgi:transposase InsO family protein